MHGDATNQVASIVGLAGGEIVGRTRLQKTAYLLKQAGMRFEFPFVYKHYGPYSEQLAAAAESAGRAGMISESNSTAAWGGKYSIYRFDGPVERSDDVPNSLKQLAMECAEVDAITLELAATALFLFEDGEPDPWAETQRRKPEKATDLRLQQAKDLYSRLADLETPHRLPPLVCSTG